MRNNNMRLKPGNFSAFLALWACCFAMMVQAQAPWGDYTLYSPQNSNKAYLLDLSGNIFKTWTFTSSQKTAYGIYMEPGGTIVRSLTGNNSSFNGAAAMSVSVQKVDYNGNVTWTYTHSSTTYVLHHDICPMPNGNVLMIAYESKTGTQAQQAGCSLNTTIWSEKIIEVQPTGATTGNIVWEWHLWEHLCQNYNATKDNYVTSIVNNPQLININYNIQKDWMHMNGVDYNPTLDQITFSSHNLNEIYVIDHSTTTAEAAGHTGGNAGKGGDILYRWGNPAAYGATGTKIFNVVHDAHWVPVGYPRGGCLGAFNNKGGTGNKTAIDVIQPPYNGYNYTLTLGSAYTPSTYTWRHTYSGSASQNLGSSQQLPNGNTFICIPNSGYLYEIDSNQTVVWSKSTGSNIAKAYRYAASYLTGISATVSATPNVICTGASAQLNVTASGGSNYTYSWASSPTGFTSALQNPVVTPSVSTTYSVTVTSGTYTTTAYVPVTVNPLPAAPVISQVGNSLSSTAASQYLWYLNGAPVSGATGQTYTPAQNGNYQVKITDANGCSAMSAVYWFELTGIVDISDDGRTFVYPNPSSGILHISGWKEGSVVLITDIHGRTTQSRIMNQVINLTGFPEGLYLMRNADDPDAWVLRVVIQK
ncbi:MAG TPA: aryl-sulfate sulfotransferase [Bacteroidales bacterium]|nr:aryl-sulfate sulfotransferase [Bacteroidales bacterium]HRZ49277.1 aryl-sulfate sulfotransferase [Bacteroidales bacterium]